MPLTSKLGHIQENMNQRLFSAELLNVGGFGRLLTRDCQSKFLMKHFN